MLNQFNNGLHSLSSYSLADLFAKIEEKLYTQALKSSINNIVKIKNAFPKLSTKKIIKVNDIVNMSSSVKLKKKITIKELSRKQVIILMDITTTKLSLIKQTVLLSTLTQILKI